MLKGDFRGLVALAALVLSACDRIPGTDESVARSALAAGLFDPDSARIRVVYRTPKAVCGSVDAKNRMGAYVGDAAFIVDRATGSVGIFSEAPSLSDFRYWRDNVREASADESWRKMESGCRFPKEWARDCDQPSAAAFKLNDKMCDAVLAGNLRELNAMVDY